MASEVSSEKPRKTSDKSRKTSRTSRIKQEITYWVTQINRHTSASNTSGAEICSIRYLLSDLLCAFVDSCFFLRPGGTVHGTSDGLSLNSDRER